MTGMDSRTLNGLPIRDYQHTSEAEELEPVGQPVCVCVCSFMHIVVSV